MTATHRAAYFAAQRRACDYAASMIEHFLAGGGWYDEEKSEDWNGFELVQWEKLATELAHRAGRLSDSEVSPRRVQDIADTERGWAKVVSDFLDRISAPPRLALPPGSSAQRSSTTGPGA